MRRFALAVSMTVGLVLGSGCQHAAGTGRFESVARGPIPILLHGVRVLDVSSGFVTMPRDILVDHGRIVSVEAASAPPPGARIIDCSGKYAVPGLFDCHTHLAHLSKNEAELRSKLAEFVTRGVLYVRDVGGPIDVLHAMTDRIAAGELSGPEIFYSGPMLDGSPLTWASMNEESPGFTVAVDTVEDVDRVVPDLARQGACMVKTFHKFDRDVYRHLVEVARRNGLRVVHDPGPPLFHRIPVDVALEFGVTSIEHAKAPWPAVLEDTLRAENDRLAVPGAAEFAQMAFMMKVTSLGEEAISPDRLRELANQMCLKGAYLCPTAQVFSTMEAMAIEQIRQQQHLDEVPEMMRSSIRQGIAAMEQMSRLFVRVFAEHHVRLLVGQDGTDPAGTFAEMRTLKEWGVSEAEIIRGATLYPAQWLGVDDRLGSIGPGRPANLLVVDGDPLEDIAALEATFMVIQNGAVTTEPD